jgi:hypothetical protein
METSLYDKYVVIKKEDLKYLCNDAKDDFCRLVKIIAECRTRDNKENHEFVCLNLRRNTNLGRMTQELNDHRINRMILQSQTDLKLKCPRFIDIVDILIDSSLD